MDNTAKNITTGTLLLGKHFDNDHKAARVAAVSDDGQHVCLWHGTRLIWGLLSSALKNYKIADADTGASPLPARPVPPLVVAPTHRPDLAGVEPPPVASETPAAVESTAPPASEPAPQPTPAPTAPDAPMVKTDASVIELILKQTAEDRSFLERRLDKQDTRFDQLITSLPGLMREAAVAAVGAMAAPALAPAPAPAPPTKEQVKRGENAKVIKAELPWARPLVDEFVAAELEEVNFDVPGAFERAMFPGEFHDALRLWCEIQGEHVPDKRTTYAILGDIAEDRRRTPGKEEKYKTKFARRRQTTFDFEPSANDVDRAANDVLAHGRKVLWPDLPAGDQSAIRVVKLLKDGKVTKDELIAAINGARIERDRLPDTARRQVTPLTVFADAARVRYLGKTFRDLGGGK